MRSGFIILAIATLLPAAAWCQGADSLRATDTASAEGAIRMLATAARDGPEKLAAIRGLNLGDERTFAVTMPVPDSWTCVLRIETTHVAVRCEVALPKGQAQAEYDALAALLDRWVERKGWGKHDLAFDVLSPARNPGTERVAAFAFRRQRRLIATMHLLLSSGGPGARVPAGSERLIVLSTRSYPRSECAVSGCW